MEKRIRIENRSDDCYPTIYRATIVTTYRSGIIDAEYVNDRAKKEVKEHGFAYINTYPERVV